MTTPLFDHVLGLADDALVSAQRMGWWISRAPQLEEDLALANIGLDLLGQALGRDQGVVGEREHVHICGAPSGTS